MKYALTKTTPAANEPITLAEAKAHLRIDSNDENDYINGLIAAAREMAEAYTARAFVTSTFTMKLDDFPDGEGAIRLPRTPLGSVTSIQYIDANGSTQTLSTDIYEVISDDTQASIVLKPQRVWPSAQFEKYHAVTITFTAGYGASHSSVPQAARSAMFLIIGNLFENREGVTERPMSTLPFGVTVLLDTVSVREVV